MSPLTQFAAAACLGAWLLLRHERRRLRDHNRRMYPSMQEPRGKLWAHQALAVLMLGLLLLITFTEPGAPQ